MSTIIQKFGGTSLGSAERLNNVAQIIQNSLKTYRIIAVVSAMSSYNKEEGTTSHLLQAGHLALTGGNFFKVLDLIEEVHFGALDESIRSPEIKKELKLSIHEELRSLKSFLEAIHVIREISPRSQDLILGTGERLSARLLTGVLQDSGVNAVYTNLSEVIPEKGERNGKQFYDHLRHYLGGSIPDHTDVLPVITGFFGFVKGGILERVGRGYTDLTAALIAAELHAEELQIWKEVDGIFTADPRKVPQAKVLDKITPAEAAELTYFGSEVLHPFTMECAIKAKVAIRIKNAFFPDQLGTQILPEEKTETKTKLSFGHKTAVAVTVKQHITILNINSNRMIHSSGFIAKVFDVFRKHRVVIDLISTSEVNISCTIDKAECLERVEEDLKELGNVSCISDRAILSLVGENMRYATGTAGKMFSALADKGVNIEMITQGASEINISCVIHQAQSTEALQVIHQTFLE